MSGLMLFLLFYEQNVSDIKINMSKRVNNFMYRKKAPNLIILNIGIFAYLKLIQIIIFI